MAVQAGTRYRRTESSASAVSNKRANAALLALLALVNACTASEPMACMYPHAHGMQLWLAAGGQLPRLLGWPVAAAVVGGQFPLLSGWPWLGPVTAAVAGGRGCGRRPVALAVRVAVAGGCGCGLWPRLWPVAAAMVGDRLPRLWPRLCRVRRCGLVLLLQVDLCTSFGGWLVAGGNERVVLSA